MSTVVCSAKFVHQSPNAGEQSTINFLHANGFGDPCIGTRLMGRRSVDSGSCRWQLHLAWGRSSRSASKMWANRLRSSRARGRDRRGDRRARTSGRWVDPPPVRHAFRLLSVSSATVSPRLTQPRMRSEFAALCSRNPWAPVRRIAGALEADAGSAHEPGSGLVSARPGRFKKKHAAGYGRTPSHFWPVCAALGPN